MAHGIGARRHPDYKVQYAAIAALYRRINELQDAKLAAIMADYDANKDNGLEPNGPEATARRQVILADPQYDTRALYAEARAIGKEVEATGLYRYDAGSLSIRYDKVGKAAWRREFERLGKPLPVELTY